MRLHRCPDWSAPLLFACNSYVFMHRGLLIKILSTVMLESFDVFILTLGSVTNVRTALSDILSAGMHTH